MRPDFVPKSHPQKQTSLWALFAKWQFAAILALEDRDARVFEAAGTPGRPFFVVLAQYAAGVTARHRKKQEEVRRSYVEG